MLAAVVRPHTKGPYPVVIVLHGTHGFAREYVSLALEISASGFLAVAPCWFKGGDPGNRVVSPPIDCPDASPMPMGPSPEARAIVADLVRAARLLPDARGDRIALFGHSRGAGAGLNYLVHGGDVQAVVLDSSGYANEFIAAADRIQARVLILHGARDAPGESATVFTSIDRAHAFEAALQRAGRAPDAHFYEDGRHDGIFLDAGQHADELHRIAVFLRGTLDD